MAPKPQGAAMASEPFPDTRRGVWRIKYKPEPLGPWKTETLGKDPRLKAARPPKTPPQFVIDRAREFQEIEYRAKHGIAAAPARARGLAAYVEAAIEIHAAARAKGSTKQLRRHADSFVAFCAERGADSVQGVTRAICRDYLEMRAAKVAPSTLKTERGYLVGIWSRAVDDGLIAVNPWAAARVKVKPVAAEPTFWAAEEIAAIVGACRTPWHGDLVLLLANTGIRISTALAMEWAWLDWSAGTITIPAGEGIKTSYVHAMGRVARDVLTRRRFAKADAPLVFPNPVAGRAGPVPYDTANDAIGRAIRRAGVRPGTPHDLRHSYARLLILAGVPVTVVQSQLGHTTLAMTMRYVATGHDTAAPFVEGLGFGA
jgi:integrase